MKRFFKAATWTVGTVVAIFIIACIIVLLEFDPNNYKAEIAAAVQRATGRDLAIQGDLKISLFPWLCVETGPMTLSNIPGFGKEPFVKISHANIKVKLLSLLKKHIEADTLTLDGLYIHLVRSPSGQTNWDDLMVMGTHELIASSSAVNSVNAPTISSLAIGGVQVKDATLIWDDLYKKNRYELDKLTLRSGPISSNGPVALDVDTVINSNAFAHAAHLRLSTQAQYDADTNVLQLKGFRLTAQDQTQNHPSNETKLYLATDAVIGIADKYCQLKGLRLLASLHDERLPDKQMDVLLNSNVAIDFTKDNLALNDLTIAAWNIKFIGQIHGDGLRESPHFTGILTIPSFSARELLSHLTHNSINISDSHALSAISAKLKFNVSSTNAELYNLDFKVDQTKITGNVTIKNFATPGYRFQLTMDKIDADRYLPPFVLANLIPVTPAAIAAAGLTKLSVKALRSLNVAGNIAIGKLKLAKLHMSDFNAVIKAKSGVIIANPVTAFLYHGSYYGNLQLDAHRKISQLAMNETLKCIEIGSLAKELLEKDLIEGTGSANLKITGAGITPLELQRTVNANLSFSLQNGRLNTFNLGEIIKNNYLKYIHSAADDANTLKQTVFSKFSASAMVANGMFSTNDLMLDSTQFKVLGRGTVNLADQQLALMLNVMPNEQLAKQLGQFRDVIIPIKLTGAFSKPVFSTNLDDVLKQKFKTKLDNVKRELIERLLHKPTEEKGELQQNPEQRPEQLDQKAQKELQNTIKNLFK